MLQRIALVPATCLIAALASPVQSATVAVAPVNTSAAVDTAPQSASGDSSGGAARHHQDLGVAVASCRMGVGLAAQNPLFLAGAGVTLCVMGIMFECEDLLSSHRP